MGERILVAMSGGVDSAAAVALLLGQGASCAGVHLRLFAGEGDETAPPREKSCCSLSDAEDARSAASRLGIPFYVFNFSALFEREVVQRFADGYARGETPNPCIDCNRFIKFGALAARAALLGYDAIATGHYARREKDAAGRFLLRKGVDAQKDQSYVLAFLTQAQLRYTHFPLGDLCKEQARAIARQSKLLNAQKRESQDICFVPDGDYGAFLERRAGKPFCSGNFVDPQGNVLGRHRGTVRYTLGQRRGLGLALPEPGYVCAVCPKNNTVTVGGEDLLFTRELAAREMNWVATEHPRSPMRCKAKVRYRQAEQWAWAEQEGESRLRLRFDSPQRAITPGQTVALYEDDYVLGAGIIDRP
ncbi:MAG: tRNA 2-thiouridine(34) synthase MnmA [Oscillospiraceae bacterium]|nr:tRNA 2-thiouridine(34) synthase MnmA [Oscillospiraceae bacterium]